MADTTTGESLEQTDLLPFDRDADEGRGDRGDTRGGFLYIGEGLTIDEFQTYLQTYDFGPVPPDFIVLHHTAKPSTRHSVCTDPTHDAGYCAKDAEWDAGEEGLSETQIKQRRQTKLRNLMVFYRDTLGWDRGPHLFIDDRYIWLFSPMAEIGIHAAQGNSYEDGTGLHYSIGIEVVGYYEHVQWPPEIERMVGQCVAALKERLGTFEVRYQPRAGGISSHRDYNKPRCPGHAITNDYYIGVLQREANGGLAGLTQPGGAPIVDNEDAELEQYAQAHGLGTCYGTGQLNKPYATGKAAFYDSGRTLCWRGPGDVVEITRFLQEDAITVNLESGTLTKHGDW